MGLLPSRRAGASGAVAMGGWMSPAWPPHRIAQRGIGLVPEGRQVFPTLTVEENLVATAANRAGGHAALDPAARCWRLFPRLGEAPPQPRRAGCRAASSRCSRSAAR